MLGRGLLLEDLERREDRLEEVMEEVEVGIGEAEVLEHEGHVGRDVESQEGKQVQDLKNVK